MSDSNSFTKSDLLYNGGVTIPLTIISLRILSLEMVKLYKKNVEESNIFLNLKLKKYESIHYFNPLSNMRIFGRQKDCSIKSLPETYHKSEKLIFSTVCQNKSVNFF